MTAEPTGVARSFLVRHVLTDSKGHFLPDDLPRGKYAVSALREDALYPDMGIPFYNHDRIQTGAPTHSAGASPDFGVERLPAPFVEMDSAGRGAAHAKAGDAVRRWHRPSADVLFHRLRSRSRFPLLIPRLERL